MRLSLTDHSTPLNAGDLDWSALVSHAGYGFALEAASLVFQALSLDLVP